MSDREIRFYVCNIFSSLVVLHAKSSHGGLKEALFINGLAIIYMIIMYFLFPIKE